MYFSWDGCSSNSCASLFILYFGTRADITPLIEQPMKGAGLPCQIPEKQESVLFRSGWFYYSLHAYLFSGTLAYRQYNRYPAVGAAIIGMVSLAAGVQGCMLIRASWYEIIVLFIVAFFQIKSGLVTDGIGISLFAIVFINQWRKIYKCETSQA